MLVEKYSIKEVCKLVHFMEQPGKLGKFKKLQIILYQIFII